MIHKDWATNPNYEGVGPKWLTVAQLKRVLAELPEDYTISVNTVGNLRVGDKDLNYKGFIDFLSEGCYEAD